MTGDLREEFDERARRRAGRPGATLWYWIQVASIGLRFRAERSSHGDALARDLSFAARQIRKHPGYSAVIVLALALGLGVNTVILGVADAVFLAPLPFPDGDRLGIVSNNHTGSSTDGFGVSYMNIRDARSRLPGVDEMALYLDWQDVNLSGTESAQRLPANFVTPNYFGMMGIAAERGRLLAEDDDREGAARAVAVLARGTWQRLFGSDPSVIGRSLILNGRPYEVVGVAGENGGDLRQRYRDTGDVAIYLPLGAVDDLLGFHIREARSTRYLNALVRAVPGSDFAGVQSELTAASAELARAHPEHNEGWTYHLTPLSEAFFEEVRTPTVVLLVGALLVLLLVCVNLTNLVLIRTASRAREWAVRRALGARGGRLVRQLVTESVLLSVTGGIAGVVMGAWGLDALAGLGGVELPAFADLGVDLRIILVTLGLAITIGLLFGVAPAGGLVGGLVPGDLRESGRQSGGRGALRLRAGLVLTEVALAFVLLVGAGLMLESFRTLRNTGYGFDTEGLLLARTDLRGEGYADESVRRATASALLDGASALPGVREAFIWSPYRLGHGNWVSILTTQGRWELYPQERIEASRHHLHPGTLARVGIPLLAGRDMGPEDNEDGVPVALVSESLARALWPGEEAVGRRLEELRGGSMVVREVVGVVADVRHRTRLIEPFGPQLDVYYPYAQLPERQLTLAVRTADERDVAALAAGVRRLVREIDPDLPVYEVATMAERMRAEEGRSRLAAILVALYSVLALALATLGVYGVLAHAVRQQTREIGIRIALGARLANVVGGVTGRGMRIVTVGIGVGAVVALAAARLLESALYGVDPWAFRVFAAVALILPSVALVACLVPALRAGRTDPVEALKAD